MITKMERLLEKKTLSVRTDLFIIINSCELFNVYDTMDDKDDYYFLTGYKF